AQWACNTILHQQQSPSPSANEDTLLKLIAAVTGEPVPSPGDHLRLSEDLHLDSLGLVQLQSELEQQLQLELSDEAIAKAVTLADLRHLITQTVTPASESHTTPSPAPLADPDSTPPTHIYPHWPWLWPIQAVRI